MVNIVEKNKRMQDIYKAMVVRGEKAHTHGFKPHTNHMDKGAYLIVLRYPDEVVQRVGEFTEAAAREFGFFIPHARDGLHTTLSNFRERTNFEPSKEESDALCDVVRSLDIVGVEIDFQDWIYDRDTLILAGYPSDAFWYLGERVQQNAQGNDLTRGKINQPDIAHMTGLRCIRDTTTRDVRHFSEYLRDKAPIDIDETTPTGIEIAHCRTTKKGFEYTTVEHFS